MLTLDEESWRRRITTSRGRGVEKAERQLQELKDKQASLAQHIQMAQADDKKSLTVEPELDELSDSANNFKLPVMTNNTEGGSTQRLPVAPPLLQHEDRDGNGNFNAEVLDRFLKDFADGSISYAGSSGHTQIGILPPGTIPDDDGGFLPDIYGDIVPDYGAGLGVNKADGVNTQLFGDFRDNMKLNMPPKNVEALEDLPNTEILNIDDKIDIDDKTSQKGDEMEVDVEDTKPIKKPQGGGRGKTNTKKSGNAKKGGNKGKKDEWQPPKESSLEDLKTKGREFLDELEPRKQKELDNLQTLQENSFGDEVDVLQTQIDGLKVELEYIAAARRELEHKKRDQEDLYELSLKPEAKYMHYFLPNGADDWRDTATGKDCRIAGEEPYIIPDWLRRLARMVVDFVPGAAFISRELTMHILQTDLNIFQCRYHLIKRRGKAATEAMDKKWDYSTEQPPYILGIPHFRTTTRKADDPILTCGCEKDMAVMEFMLFKTWKISSRAPNGGTETMGSTEIMNPRWRGFVVENLLATSWLEVDDFFITMEERAQGGWVEAGMDGLKSRLVHAQAQRLGALLHKLVDAKKSIQDVEMENA
ncbi:hypothetical protein MKEN_00325400 [Mycena kentingensis (nom. inval.)]|nr:hypothetical protein MKEN_00325400 [Mycena kentingensis (nom. inval.)]